MTTIYFQNSFITSNTSSYPLKNFPLLLPPGPDKLSSTFCPYKCADSRYRHRGDYTVFFFLSCNLFVSLSTMFSKFIHVVEYFRISFLLKSEQPNIIFYKVFLKSLLNLLQHCFCFMFWFFGPEACGILVSLSRDQTYNPFIGRRSLNHWTAREVPWCVCVLLIDLFGCTGSLLWHAGSLVVTRGIQFPDQGSNPGPLRWERRVLATGPPGKSLNITFFLFFFQRHFLKDTVPVHFHPVIPALFYSLFIFIGCVSLSSLPRMLGSNGCSVLISTCSVQFSSVAQSCPTL